ncbi:MAG: hypothetical protein ACHP8B_18140 [Terriglobales bacterium]
MANTLIDFAGDQGTPFSVYEAEQDAEGKIMVLRTIFKPHPAQVEFFSATERHVLLHGNRGCGKSASLLWKAIQIAYLVPGCRVAIFRKTWPELQRSIWDELLKLPQDLFHDINASNHTVTIRAKDRDGQWKLSKIWFLTAQNIEDARKVLSFEVHTLLIDEWAEVEPELWRFLSGSVRSPLEVDIAGRPTSAQIYGASTPGGAGAEALKCLFGCDGEKRQAPGEDKGAYRPEKYRAIKASIDQNPTYAVGTQAGDDYRSSLKDLPLTLQAKWIRGDWGAIEGCYFSIWDTSRMVTPFAEIKAECWDSHFISIDYGFGRSWAAAYMHVVLGNGRIVTMAEIVEQQMPVYEFAAEIVRCFDLRGEQHKENRRNVVAVYADPANFSPMHDIRVGTAGHSVADQINDALDEFGLAVQQAGNDRIGGWQLMFQLLARGQWLIADTCPILISAIPLRTNDPKKHGDILKVPGDRGDDAMDAARYGLFTWVTASEKPQELVMREMMKPFVEQEEPDLTSAYIRYQQKVAELDYGEQAARLGIRISRRRRY